MTKIFLTGGTGFIGRKLLPKLAERNQVFLMTRKGLPFLKEMGQNISVIKGDLEKKNLGLSSKDREILSDVDYVYHLAASYDLSLPQERIFEIIFGGTKRLVEVLAFSKLRALVHISTAYVAGAREGIISEDQLATQVFHNAYEEAKFKTEVFLQGVSLPHVVIRPALVVGDSQTGKFDGKIKTGFYQLISAIDRGLLFFYPGKSAGFVSSVPVDWVSEAIINIGKSDKAVGKTFHLADPKPMTSRQFIDRVCRILGRKKPFFEMPETLLNCLPSKKLRGQIMMLNQKQTFDMTNTISLLGKSRLAPTLDFYLENLLAYYKCHLR